jgi:ABC-type branched-subunit amino acid transport system ATPase component/nitrogen-specific signal transduction histidine kinase
MEYHLQERGSRSQPSGPLALLRLKNINFNRDNIQVLKNISLDLHRSEFHAIVGDHGSGKSTLGMIICGAIKPASGELLFKDASYPHFTLRKARKLNIEMASQEIQLIHYFSVAENLLIPDKVYHPFPLIKKRRLIQEEAGAMLSGYGFDIDPASIINNLPLSDRMVIHILRSMYRKPDLLILDAVLEKLAATHLEKILDILSALKKTGKSILCFTHSIDDIYGLADKVTILRNGEIILTDSVNNIDKINLIKLCYTQISGSDDIESYQDFIQLLRYNEAILQKLPINLIVSDNENKIKMINDHGKVYFNLEKADYRNLYLDGLFSEGSGNALELIKSAFSEKKEKTFYNVPIVVNGNKTITNIKILPIYDGAFLIGNITIIEDVSRQEKLRQQMILSEKLASVGILAAGVAHEINNPLEIIYNHLNFLKFHIDKEKMYETIANIEEELTDIKQIVSNLISFSDSNKLVNEEFELNGLIASIINLIRFNAKNKKIRIEYTPAGHPIHLNANMNEIKQVILNLLKNSFEASEGGGEICIQTSSVIMDGGPFACIVFRDDGIGIDDENPDNIFLPFYSTKKGNEANLGLGLSVSYGIVKKYKGSISVKNLKGFGCEFTITLPQKTGKGL